MLHKRTLRELSLAAGLWLLASAAMAAPQPGQDMPLGLSALPPEGYVDFCERKPADCGADMATVEAGARRAEATRNRLLALMKGSMTAAIEPAGAKAASAETASPDTAVEPVLTPLAPLQTLDLEAAPILTQVAFVDPARAALEAAEARTPRMTPALWALLNRVNGEVNGAIRPRTDLAVYGRPEYWNTPLEDGLRTGDCEDYVLEKERALIAAGFPRAALNIAVVVTRWGETHAVLLASTNEGDFVLDNLTPWLMTWREAPYIWRSRQVNGEAFNWVMVMNPAGPRLPAPKGLLIASSR